MIFKSNYRQFMASKQIKSGGLTVVKSLTWAVISVVLTFAAYLVILLLNRDNSASVPPFFYSTHFGLLYLYTVINSFVILVVLLINSRFPCFTELTANRWSLLISMGVPISGMVNSKVISSFFALTRQYLIGFLLTALCGSIANIPFSLNYLVALFFTGVITLTLFVTLAMAASVFLKKVTTARALLLISFAAVQALLVRFEFYHSDMFQVEVIVRMFSLAFPSFITVSAALYLVSYAVILFVSRERAQHQELMPLGVFDIKPLVTGDEEELFMSSGEAGHTTIIDAEILKDERSYASSFEKPHMFPNDEQARFPYALFIVLSLILLGLSAVLLAVALFIPSLMPSLLGDGLAAVFTTPAGKAVLGILTAVFCGAAAALSFYKRRNRS